MSMYSYIEDSEIEEFDPEVTLHNSCADRVQAALIDLETSSDLARMFSALADGTRLRILSALRNGEVCVGDLTQALGMTQSAISHQLRILRAMAIVKARKDGRMVFYYLDDEHISDLFERGLQHLHHSKET